MWCQGYKLGHKAELDSILTLLWTSSMTLGKVFSLLSLSFLICKMKVIIVFIS